MVATRSQGHKVRIQGVASDGKPYAQGSFSPAYNPNVGPFFIVTPLQLGREANQQAQLLAGRAFYKAVGTGVGTVSGAWDISAGGPMVQVGENYRYVCIIRAVVIATGALYSGSIRLIARLGTHAGLGPDPTITLLDQTVTSGFISVDANSVFNGTHRYFGALALSVPDGVRIEIINVSIGPYVTPVLPWDDIPNAPARTINLNGILMPTNGTLATPILIPPNASQVHCRLTYNGLLNGNITASAYVFLTVYGFIGFVAGDVTPPVYSAWWRPGDSADLWVTINIPNPRSVTGNEFRISFRTFGLSGVYTDAIFRIDPAAVQQGLPGVMPFHRKPYVLDLTTAVPLVSANLETMQWSDTGFVGNASSGTPCWRSRFSFGYSQDGNQENGLYVNTDAFPAQAMNPHSLEHDSNGRPLLRLHSAKFPTPVLYNGNLYPFQATCLTAQKMNEWNHQTGIWRAAMVTPSQHGAWSAFWTTGQRTDTDPRQSIWPPEIDFFEHFNAAYGGTYTQYSTSSAQHVGVHGSNSRSEINGMATELDQLGFNPAHNAWTQIHEYTCVVTPDWITHFVDNIEVMQHRNMTRSTDGNTNWALYPIINVAVKEDPLSEYSSGTTDMLVYGLHYYEPTANYTMTEYNVSAPFPNRQTTPTPDLTYSLTLNMSGVGSLNIAFEGATFFDDFNRADEPLGNNTYWTRVNGTPNKLTIVNGILSHSALTVDTLYTSPDYGSPNHFVEVRCKQTALVIAGQIVCRVVDPSNWLGFRIVGTTGLQLWKRVANTMTMLGSTTVAVDDIVRLEIVGTAAVLKRNGVSVITATVTEFAGATKTGFYGTGNNAATEWVDDFRSGPL